MNYTEGWSRDQVVVMQTQTPRHLPPPAEALNLNGDKWEFELFHPGLGSLGEPSLYLSYTRGLQAHEAAGVGKQSRDPDFLPPKLPSSTPGAQILGSGKSDSYIQNYEAGFSVLRAATEVPQRTV